MPFLGILEDHTLPHVPGTVLLDESAVKAKAPGAVRLLRHGRRRDANIVLVPQPSDDPNDPLNWSYGKKMTVLCVTLLGSIFYFAVITAMLNPSFSVIAADVHAPLSKVVLTSGYFTLTVGITGPFFSAVAHKYGKRPCFLFSAVMALAGHIVGATVGTRSYRGLVAARVLQGFSASPYESLIYAVVSDIFFVHERGLYIAITNFVIIAITNLTGAVSGPIASAMGWEWLWYFMIIFGGIHIVLQFFLVPETSYVRDARRNIDRGTEDKIQDLAAAAAAVQDGEKGTVVSAHIDQAPRECGPGPPKKTFWQGLAIYTTTYSEENLLQLYFAPWGVMMNMAIAVVVLVYSLSLVMFIVVAFIIPQAFARAPYHMNSAGIGRLSFGPFIGGAIASILNGLLSDRLIRWCARRNRGVYEPEYRLILAFLAFFTGASLMGWGVAVADGLSPYACATLHGLILFGIVFAVSGVSSYAVDSYSALTAEIFICCQTFKNFFAFGFSYFVNDWTVKVGMKHSFYAWGALSLGLTALLPFLFVFGKKYRSYWARHNLLQKWHILTHQE